jgi:type I restriction-modification system DNA methylase subunit
MKFDPTKAEAVEDDVFDKFMEHMNARAQSKQLQQAADSLRVLLEMTRRDSEELLSKYRDEFDTWIKQRDGQMQEKLMDAAASTAGKVESDVKKMTGKVEESFDRVMTRADAMSTSLGRVEKLVKDLAAVPRGMDPDNGSIRTILSEVATIRAQLETPREDKMGILIDMVKAMKEAPPQERKKSWTFAVERDDFARIKNVTATSD